MDARTLSRKLPPILKKTGEIHAIVETPKGSRNKFDFDPQTGLFELGSAMPEGVEFPFEFGFIPGTLGEEKEKDSAQERNDRLIAVAVHSRHHQQVQSLDELPKELLRNRALFHLL